MACAQTLPKLHKAYLLVLDAALQNDWFPATGMPKPVFVRILAVLARSLKSVGAFC